jgi:hypothetical protein
MAVGQQNPTRATTQGLAHGRELRPPPGVAAKIPLDGAAEGGARTLGDASVNIEYAYCATSPGSKNGLLVLRPSNPKKALKVLNTVPVTG